MTARNAGMDEEIKMVTTIREYLENKRYVIFFDDVWKREFWSDIEHALLDNNKGGRIVITTRSLGVANFCKTSSYVHVHMLQPLPSEKAWQLFCNRAFHFEFGGSYSGKIVERCKGLPLAIVAVAGLLSTKEKTVNEWRKLHDNLSSEFESNPHLTSISRILSLSYNDLPYYLKNCYLYFGMYPEDYSIKSSRLIRQWVSEGFITSKRDKTLEEVAQEYLMELMNRSLVQVSEVNYCGKPTECRIHDLLREVILQKMKDIRFGSHYFSSDRFSFLEVTRRLTIHNTYSHVHSTNKKYSHVRGMLVFTDYYFYRETTFCEKFKLLKVLDFEDAAHLIYLPKDIGDLFHLKYLSVAHTRVEKLPSSIRKLQNLETLNLKGSWVYVVHSHQINTLHKLRHLFVHRRISGNDFHWPGGLRLFNGFGCLALQMLYNVHISADIEELKKLTQLRKLGLTGLGTTHEWSVACDCIKEMKHLESLRVYGNEIVDLDSFSSPPEFLQSLLLGVRLKNLPEWITKLQNLAKFQILLSGLEDDPLEVLQNLPNLVVLIMAKGAYVGEKLHFKQGMFQKLKRLQLQDMDNLNSLIIEEGALPTLEQLIIAFCSDGSSSWHSTS